jgi:hypothetical protein
MGRRVDFRNCGTLSVGRWAEQSEDISSLPTPPKHVTHVLPLVPLSPERQREAWRRP